jgi:hypothetical protein
MTFKEEAGAVLAFVEQRLWEIEAVLRTDACVTDHIPGNEKTRKLALSLLSSMASYWSCIEEDQRWDSEVFSGLACNIESALRDHGLKPPAEGDEEDLRDVLSEGPSKPVIEAIVRLFFKDELQGTEFLEEIVKTKGDCDWVYVEENLGAALEDMPAYETGMRILWEKYLVPLGVTTPPHILRDEATGEGTRKTIAWSAKTDCEHCKGTGLRRGARPVSVAAGSGDATMRLVCSCVESTGGSHV